MPPDFDNDGLIDEIDPDDDNDMINDDSDDFPLDFERYQNTSKSTDETKGSSTVVVFSILGFGGIIFSVMIIRKKFRYLRDSNQQDVKSSNLIDVPADTDKGILGDDGYEWFEHPRGSGKHFYRVPGASEWIKWDD